MIDHPNVTGMGPAEDSRTPIEKMRRKEVSRRLFLHGVEHEPGRPKDILVALAEANGVDLTLDEAPEEPSKDISEMNVMELRKLAADSRGMAWKDTEGLKKPELLALLGH